MWIKSAIYLLGHAAEREPRFIEMQYYQLLRYIGALEEKLGQHFEVEGVFIDLNIPRGEQLSQLKQLVGAIRQGGVNTVFINIHGGDPRGTDYLGQVTRLLETEGVKVFNACYDNEKALQELIVSQCGEDARSWENNDDDDFVMLFPATAAAITRFVIEEHLGDPELDRRVWRSLDFLAKENPHQFHSIPLLSERKWRWIRKRQEAREDERRLTETLYQMGPSDNPRLLEEGIYGDNRARNAEELAWAEERLTKQLSFERVCKDRVVSYTRIGDEHVVYADPRKSGIIYFHVYYLSEKGSGRPPKKRWGRRLKAGDGLGQFYMRDQWHKDLAQKYLKYLTPILQESD
jgi:hypothetical protein